MNAPACITMVICSLTVLFTAGFLPFLHFDLRRRDRPPFPRWTAALAGLALMASIAALSRMNLNQNQLIEALGLAAALVAGVGGKWLMEIAAQKKFTIHERELFRALLLAPLAIALAPGLFGTRLNPPTLALWFLNGFFWHTVVSDLERLVTREPVIIRRREPPTLPYDFRRPRTEND